MVEPPLAVTVTAYEPADKAPELGPLGSIPPLPQPLRMPRVESARSRVKTLQRRVRRGRKKSSRQEARVTLRLVAPRLDETLAPWERPRN